MKSQGMITDISQYDICRGAVRKMDTREEMPVRDTEYTIKVEADAHAESAVFSPDGQSFVTGSADGYIEVWNAATGTLREDLSYQSDNQLMSMESAILALAFSPNSALLASGAQSGEIKVWKVLNGTVTKKFPCPHKNGVTCMTFSADGTNLVSAGYDGIIK